MFRIIKFIPLFLIAFFILTIIIHNHSKKTFAQTAPICSTTAPSDVVITIDRSLSMKDPGGSSGTKMSNARSSAKRFVDILSTNSNNRVGLSSFYTEGTIDAPLSNNWSSVKTEIDNLVAGGDTCTECGVFKGNRNLHDNGRPGIKKVIILLTDGRANVIQGSHDKVSETVAENAAIAEVKKSHKNDGTIFFTIGLGNDINISFLKEIASLTGGKYYASPTTDQLNSIYDQISQIIAKGSISGAVFNDINSDSIWDSAEPALPGWNVQLIKTGATPVNQTTNVNGAYSFGGLCDGSYMVKQTLNSSFQQTFPLDNNYYTLAITNGNPLTDNNFGNTSIPVTPLPSCVQNTPTLEVTPDTQTGGANETKKFSVKITNNDSAECPQSPIIPSGYSDDDTNWNLNFEVVDFNYKPGTTKTIDLSVTPSLSAIDGPNTITVNANKPNSPLVSTNVRYILNNPLPTNGPSPEPTAEPTSTPNSTFLNLKIGTDGIGSTPRIPIGGNKNPQHLNRNLTVRMFKATDNSHLEIWNQTFTYNPVSQKFEGRIESLDSGLQTGIYNIFIEGPQLLRGRLTNSIEVTKGQTIDVPIIDLITGDINKLDRSNNKIDLSDYNILISCSIYSKDRSTCELDPKYQRDSDLDDDGIVNENDFTLWLKEVGNQEGVALP